MKKQTKIIIALVASSALVLMAFGAKGNAPVNVPGGHSEVASIIAPQAVASVGAIAPDFALKSLSGEDISLSSFRGEKPVILDFFATWCPNCKRDMPKLSKWYDEHKDSVEVIGVNLQEGERKVRSFVEDKSILFPIVLDPQSSVARNYGVQYTNYHVMIDKDGLLVGFVPGDISESDILGLING